MKKLAHFFEQESGKRVKNIIIGLGASVVLMGALFKLQHWPYAGTMLIIGMCTEAFIFALLGLLPPHADYYWEKIYPELNIAPDEEELKKSHALHAGGGASVTQQLDKMLENAHVEPELISRLGQNLGKLGESITKMSEIADAGAATGEYTTNAKAAANALSEMKVAYANATSAANLLASAANETKAYHEQVQITTKNLAQLNAIYELELQDTNSHLKTMNKFYGSLSSAMDNLNESLDDTRKYRDNMSGLAKNLSSLNQIYGNMLSAMAMGAQSK